MANSGRPRHMVVSTATRAKQIWTFGTVPVGKDRIEPVLKALLLDRLLPLTPKLTKLLLLPLPQPLSRFFIIFFILFLVSLNFFYSSRIRKAHSCYIGWDACNLHHHGSTSGQNKMKKHGRQDGWQDSPLGYGTPAIWGDSTKDKSLANWKCVNKIMGERSCRLPQDTRWCLHESFSVARPQSHCIEGDQMK